MNYKKILLLISALTLVGCKYSETIAAKPPQIIASSLPAQPNASTLAIPLSYKIESYDSKVMLGKRTYGVSLPPGYDQNPQQHYPVIFLLHGGHGEPLDWFSDKKGQALKTLTKLYTTGKLPPSIIITPDGNDKRGSSPYFDPQYIDGPNGKVSTAVGYELVKIVQSRYRTLPNPDFWAMGGLSSGGWGAMNVGLHNLQNFSILFSHSGYFKDKTGPQNSPIIYIKTLPSPAIKRLRIYLDSGESDTEELNDAKEFSQVLSQQKVYNLFRQFPGSHTWQYWREHLADSLTFVGEQFRIAEIAHAADNVGVKPAKTQQNH
ncbi:esterase family protein [Nostoc sp. FACHB-152]|uniref:alpha/beta hydrolase n=1 Tax=unclassified Nostoc TaxID=2593658 RepID=UPI00168683AA|nr:MULTISPECIES: alpha/beta hydrolase-fold protein [unclassified Nostoc]MBD2450619.1 esterase family protein [Nostoc sp. FACHB-152]MBD2470087.1 esterase family protein [Nostoc sp. FACHB-145]